MHHLSFERSCPLKEVCSPPSQFYFTDGTGVTIAKLAQLLYIIAQCYIRIHKGNVCSDSHSVVSDVCGGAVCVCVNMVDMGKEEPPTLTG